MKGERELFPVNVEEVSHENLMKLKEHFITYQRSDEQIMVDVSGEFSGLVRNNETAAFIVNCLKHDITQEEIVEALSSEYNASKDVLKADTAGVLEKLRSIGALVE